MPDRELHDKTENGKSFIKNEGGFEVEDTREHGADSSGKALDMKEKRTEDGKHIDGSHKEILHGPISGEEERSGRNTDQ